MDFTEKEIWEAHRKRFAQIQRELKELDKKYQNDLNAFDASFGGKDKIPPDVRQRLDEQYIKDLKQIQQKEHNEIVRIQEEMSKHDEKRLAQKLDQQNQQQELERLQRQRQTDEYMKQYYPKDIGDEKEKAKVLSKREQEAEEIIKKWEQERQRPKSKEPEK